MTDPLPRSHLRQPAAAGLAAGVSADALSSMFQAVRGLHNTRALAAMLGCLAAGVLVAGMFSVLATWLGAFMALLAGVALFVAAATGVNAAGALLLDQARGRPARSLAAAVRAGLLCIPKTMALGLGLLLVAAAVFIGIALAYFICKIPYLGPLLFVAVFPLSVLISGVTVCGLFLCLFLSLPALWEGLPIARAIGQALTIARTRLVEAMLLTGVVGLLSAAVGMIVFGVLLTGLMPTLGLSASILGGDGVNAVMAMAQGAGDGGHAGSYGGRMYAGAGGGHAAAAGIGGGLLWSLAMSLVAMVYLLGLNLVYLRVTEGLEGTERLRGTEGLGGTDALRGNEALSASAAAPDAEQSTLPPPFTAAPPAPARVSGPAPDAAPNAAPNPAPSAVPRPRPAGATAPSGLRSSTCPQCLSAVGTDDVFCGVCGHRLR